MIKARLSAVVLVFVSVLLVTNNVRASGEFYMGTGLGIQVPDMKFDSKEYDSDPGDSDPGFVWEILHLGYNSDFGPVKAGIGAQLGASRGSFSEDHRKTDDWTQGYLVVSGRYTLKVLNKFNPYGELGVGSYYLKYEPNDSFALGIRGAIGANIYPVEHFYIGPEISYHWAKFDGGDYEDEVKFNSPMFLIKTGVCW